MRQNQDKSITIKMNYNGETVELVVNPTISKHSKYYRLPIKRLMPRGYSLAKRNALRAYELRIIGGKAIE